MKRFTLIELLIIVAGLVFIMAIAASQFGCAGRSSSADAQLGAATEQAMKEMVAQTGMPAIKNWQERKLAKMIFELRDQENLVCYAYLVNKMQGKLVYFGKCIGFGLPYSVQYTNPKKLVDRYGRTIKGPNYDIQQLPQADPNGLFMPEGLSATWLMMLDKQGEPHPVYIEPEIVVSPFPLH